jgi:oligoribonuclease
VCFDRRFLIRHMPKLETHFHYRNVDVSSIKELARRWRPAVVEKQTKQSRHRALDDVRESIAELRLYREAFFQEPPCATP